MPRLKRVIAGGVIYHVLNRANGRTTLFHDDGDRAPRDGVDIRTRAVALSPDGRRAATADAEEPNDGSPHANVTRIWDVGE